MKKVILSISKLSKKTKHNIYIILGIILLFLLWWIISLIVKSTLFPSPFDIIYTSFLYLGKGITYKAIGGTFLRLLISFLISFILGIILGVLSGKFYRLEFILKPIIGFLRSLPTAAIVLILIVLLKPIWTPIIVSSLVMFPIIYSATLEGIKNIDKDLKDDMKLYSGNYFYLLFKIYIPLIFPFISLSIVQSFGLGLKVSIMAEILAGSNNLIGLGRLIHIEYLDANAKNVLALSLIAILIIVIIELLFDVIKKRINKYE